MSYDTIRLQKGDDIIAYLAPSFEINPVMKNDLFAADRPQGRGTIVRDNQTFRFEIVAQGVFENSRNLPQEHDEALQDLFDKGVVSPRDQVNRVKEYLLNEGGPYEFYEGADEYTAYDMDDADYADGIFPTVQVDEFRPTREMGSPRFEYMISMIVGEDPSGLSIVTRRPTATSSTTATIVGDVVRSDDPVDVNFEYRTVGSDVWESTAVQVQDGNGTFSADLTELQSSTSYEYKALGLIDSRWGTTTSEGDIRAFQTESDY